MLECVSGKKTLIMRALVSSLICLLFTESSWTRNAGVALSNDLHTVIQNLQNEIAGIKSAIEAQASHNNKTVDILNENIERQREEIKQQNATIARQSEQIKQQSKNFEDIKKQINYQNEKFYDIQGLIKRQDKKIDQLIDDVTLIKSILQINPGSKRNPAKSCNWLKKNVLNVTSGFYWISLKTPTQVYCDMENKLDGGGWTMVGSVASASEKDADWLSSANITSSSIGELTKVNTTRFLLSASGLRELRSYISFTQMRFYCTKPWHGRTVHIQTSLNNEGFAVSDLMTGRSDYKPFACSSFKRMYNDNSILGGNCAHWVNQRWWDFGDRERRMFNYPFWINEIAYFGLHSTGSLLCDDYDGPRKDPKQDRVGKWAFYVR